jgi:hypothetical protein
MQDRFAVVGIVQVRHNVRKWIVLNAAECVSEKTRKRNERRGL